MPRLPFDAFSRQLKAGEIPPALYLYGEEDLLKDEAVAAILARVVDPATRDFNYDQRAAAQLDPEAVETLCTTLPMMADRRLVVIREVEAWQKRARAKAAVLKYLEKPLPETVLVLVQGAARRDDDRAEPDPDLLRLTAAVEVERLSPRLAEKWVHRRAEERGIRLAPETAAHLVKAVEGDLGAARSELDKLAGLSGAEPIALEVLSASLGVRHGETAADWCDAVLEGNSGAAALMLPHLLARPGVSGVSLLALLGTHLIGLGLARGQWEQGQRGAGLERAVRETLLRTRPPVRLDYRSAAERWGRLAEHWDAGRVRAAVHAARRADRRLKETSLSDEGGVLADLVFQLCPIPATR